MRIYRRDFFSRIILIFMFICLYAKASPDAKRLVDDLFKGYSNMIMPISQHNDVLNVTVRFIPRGITEFNEVTSQISIAMGVDVRWTDIYLHWNPKKYGNVTHLVVPEDKVWTPDISLANPTDRIPIFPEDLFSVRIYYNGLAIWLKGGTVRSTCKPNLRYYPFDVHTCYVKFITLDHVFKEINLIAELKLNVYANFGEWDIFDNSAYSEPFDFSSAVYKFKIKRRPEFSILSICIPILCLGLLNACAFLIPPECGERISFAITVLLSFAVFMTIVSATMPKNTAPVPILCYILMLMLLESGIIVVVSILGLRLYYKPDHLKPPDWLKGVVKTLAGSKRRSAPPSSTYREVIDNNQTLSVQENMEYEHIKWVDVGHAFDYFCFTVSFFAFIITVCAYAIIVMAN
ncbi:acetylcholine receptor subunit alpha-like 2 [Saccostrea echinata]|uniref:acetylcholine receptor subunit alpha-like 2 n=1 Tax=Saccostrea echinata TaxID=191078 RepID=UPI002A80FDA3|nr:acetylcholine receptor subunit alpha-like 2 [Saccostrea echinata]